WSVLAGVEVSGGFLRVERLPVAALLDVVVGFEDLIAGRLAPDPPAAAWFLGAPGGRSTIGMRPADGSGDTNKCQHCGDVCDAGTMQHWTEGDGRGYGHLGLCCDCMDLSCGMPLAAINAERVAKGKRPITKGWRRRST